MLDGYELFTNLGFNQTLRKNGFDKIKGGFQLEHQILNRKMEVIGWRLDESNSITIRFHETTDLNGSRYVKFPSRSSTIINIENHCNYCFPWSIFAGVHLSSKIHPKRV